MGHRPQPKCHRAQASIWGWGWDWFFPRVGQSNMLSGVLGYFFYRARIGCTIYVYYIYYSRYVAASVGFNIVYEASPQSKRKELNTI